MLVIVTEDDPQGGRDHVEAHRSLLMLIGPHVKRGYVSHALADFGSIMRLIFTLLGLPPLNQFDARRPAAARLLRGRGARRRAVRRAAADRRLFDPDAGAQAVRPRGSTGRQLAASPRLDDPEDMRRPFDEPGTALAGVVRAPPAARHRA